MNSRRSSSSAGNRGPRQANSAAGVLGIELNYDGSCFAVGLETGYRVYSTEPLAELLRRELDDGGVSQVAMLQRSNILAIVGGGKNPLHALNKVVLVDEKTGKVATEIEFRSEVRAVRLHLERIIVLLAGKIHFYSLQKVPRLLQSIECSDCNDSKVLALGGSMLAFPAKQVGHVQVVRMAPQSEGHNTSIIINAHETCIACLALDQRGELLATTSEKGTLIRLFDVRSGRLRGELRRGAERAQIYSIAFNPDGTRLCVASDTGTVHIFNVPSTRLGSNFVVDTGETVAAEFGPAENRQSSLSFMKELLPKYFSSEWSFASVKLPELTPCIAVFGRDQNSIIVISEDGLYSKFTFDPSRIGESLRSETRSQYLALPT